MNFLEATRILRAFEGGPAFPFLLGMSGTPDPLVVYLRAAAAQQGLDAQHRFLPFNTLQQAVYDAPTAGESEVFLLFPWDVIPELDWRSGVPQQAPDEAMLRARATQFLDRVATRSARLLYVPAPCPPLWLDPARNEALSLWLQASVRALHADVLDVDCFALSTYLASGSPLASARLGEVASRIVMALRTSGDGTAKVLVTDLDETMWSGIIGDDGADGIAYRAEGRGFRHFLYQTLLRRLKDEGVLLAAVTKNDPEVALVPFQQGEMVLQRADFVAFLASWNAKSSQIQSLAQQLNLGLDAFVFVDDNPVELAEVARELPAVHAVQFPDSERGIAELLHHLTAMFRRTQVTAEDRERTALYQRRLEGLVPSDAAGADIAAFLRELDMSLTIVDRSTGDRTRAVQLLNKTNQFNLNGIRLTDQEVGEILADGGSLFTATLADRTGSHGEILAAILDREGVLTSMVMSCRVFQRRVEYAFVAWLAAQGRPPKRARYVATERNTPTRRFLEDLAEQVPADGDVSFDDMALTTRFAADLALFRIAVDGAR